MLNIGQVIFDFTSKRAVVFAGFDIPEHGGMVEAFITEEGEFIKKSGDDVRQYTNFVGTPIPSGSFIDNFALQGCYFGMLDEDLLTPNDIQLAVDAIKEFNTIGWHFTDDGKPKLNSP